jgi:hypothetical protein
MGRLRRIVYLTGAAVLAAALLVLQGASLPWHHHQHDHRKPDHHHQQQRVHDGPPPPPLPPSANKRRGTVYDSVVLSGKAATSLLLGGADEWPDRAVSRMKFRPGTLTVDSNAAFQHCHVDPTRYRQHFTTRKKRVLISEQHKLLCMQLPKSGSSTAKDFMFRFFGGREISGDEKALAALPGGKYSDFFTLAFVRDPMSRFFSSYEEMIVRTGPFAGKYGSPSKLPARYNFLFEGLPTYSDYENVFCPPGSYPDGKRSICIWRESHENGTLAMRMVRFVHEWDPADPFDSHLKLQAPQLSDERTGDPMILDAIYDTHNAAAGWDAVAARASVTFPAKMPAPGRAYPRRLNLSKVPDATRREICRITAIDNCCFNLPLPPACADNDAAGVFCALERRPNEKQLRITPWNPLPLPGQQWET